MTLEAWLTVGLSFAVFLALAFEWAPSDALFLGAAVILAALGVITPKQAFAGFANSGVLTVAALYIVAAALRETGVLEYVGHHLFGRVRTDTQAILRLAAFVVPVSAFMNNTPVVAMLLPVVLSWCRRNSVSPSKLLIPLSFLTILGGTCTLIGTSTNLVVQGLMLAEQIRPMSLFEIGKVGLPNAVIGTLFLLTIGRRLLPARKEAMTQFGEQRRDYLVEMLVQRGCRLAGQSIEQAGLRRLPGLFLIDIDRAGQSLGPVGPEEVIQADDRLIFTGVVSTIVDLERIPGLVPATDQLYDIGPQSRRGRQLCEAVVSARSPLIGKAIRDADFRALYGAAVVAVHRDGARMTNKIGDIELRAADTLLLQTGRHFSRAYRNSTDFYLVSEVADSRPLRRDRAWIAVAIFAVLLVGMVSNFDTAIVSFLAAGLMVGARCISIADARESVDWATLVTIAASFGVGTALESSGAARVIAERVLTATHSQGPVAALAALYFITMVLNELVTNNAAAVLAFPFAIAVAHRLGVDGRPFIMAVALASSNAYASPIGYQTHMMVYGPGGYRFGDFMRVGIPLNLLLWISSIILIPYAWPF